MVWGRRVRVAWLISLVLVTGGRAITLPRPSARLLGNLNCLPLETVSGGKTNPVPAAFLAACVLGNAKSKHLDSAREHRIRVQQGAEKGVRMVVPRFVQGLRDVLRGGGGFRREGNEAKYRSRPRVGVDVSFGFSVALAFLSVVCVGSSLPLFWSTPASLSESFWLTRIVVLRALAFVYFVAFAVAFTQNSALLGDNGLLPASVYLDRVREQNPSLKEGFTWQLFSKYPTWLWLAPDGQMDKSLRLTAAVGMLLSLFVFLNGGSNVLIQAALWLLYHSIVTVGETLHSLNPHTRPPSLRILSCSLGSCEGSRCRVQSLPLIMSPFFCFLSSSEFAHVRALAGQRWYGFGWESQLLETGFISILMVPLTDFSALPPGASMPWVAIWALRWLCFRIMIGAGMIKIRGDSCWRDLTAMCYHYETQPGSGRSSSDPSAAVDRLVTVAHPSRVNPSKCVRACV